MMKKGSSVPWPVVLKEFTNGRSDRIDPKPMLEYFEPLVTWLKNQNLTNIDWSCDSYINTDSKTFMSYDSYFKQPPNQKRKYFANLNQFTKSSSASEINSEVSYLFAVIFLALTNCFKIKAF